VIEFSVKYIICDAPARAHIKRTRQYNFTRGCDKCEVKGKKDLDLKCMLFKDETAHLRTDEKFHAFDYRKKICGDPGTYQVRLIESFNQIS
jgi:hypothetical protein